MTARGSTTTRASGHLPSKPNRSQSAAIRTTAQKSLSDGPAESSSRSLQRRHTRARCRQQSWLRQMQRSSRMPSSSGNGSQETTHSTTDTQTNTAAMIRKSGARTRITTAATSVERMSITAAARRRASSTTSTHTAVIL